MRQQFKSLYLVFAVCAAFLVSGCASSPQSAPQIPLAPVYQAGSPVVVNVQSGCGSCASGGDAKKGTEFRVERVGHDARGNVDSVGGGQAATPTQTTDVTTEIPVDATGGAGSAVKTAVKAATGGSAGSNEASPPTPGVK